MYRVMIIDDEKALRSLLKASVNWKEMGLEIAGEAASGIEAINTIDKFHPDIIFVDIRMPFMDGIEFSKIALKRYPGVKIIILTAFDEFEYAKQCIGLGITDLSAKTDCTCRYSVGLQKSNSRTGFTANSCRTIFSHRYAIRYGPHQTIYYGKLPRFILESYCHCTGIWL